MRKEIIFILLLLPAKLLGQLTIGNVQVATAENTVIQANVSGDLNNASDYTFSNARLHLSMTGDIQSITGNWVFSTLSFSNGSEKNIFGNVIVTDDVDFTSGKINIGQSGKFLYSGTEALQGTSNSYVTGLFFTSGQGTRSYPVGTSALYAPFNITEAVEAGKEIGVQAREGDPGISLPEDPDIEQVLTNFHWEVTSGSPVDATIAVSLAPFVIQQGLEAMVVQREGTVSENLRSANDNSAEFVSSSERLTGSIVGVATTTEINVVVNNLITPYSSPGVNDKLHISKIKSIQLSNQKVSLLDRYGVPIKSWEGEAISEDIDYDFSKLSPGNYICVVEYTRAGKAERILQMVTLLKN
jgi:hypothetical protein